MEPVLFWVGSFLAVSGLRQQNLELFIPHVAEAFVKEEAEDVVLELPCIDMTAQDVRRAPEVTFEFRL
jgi:hypothetical protein